MATRERLAPGERSIFAVAIACIAVASAVSIGIRPIADPSEGRYAAIARTMADSGDWVTPRVLVDGRSEPYLGKPPFAFWTAAASIRAFGASEWAARVPSLLATWLTVALVFAFANRRWGPRTASTAALIGASMPLVVSVGFSVTIDVGLALAITLTLVAFGSDRRFAAYGVFAGFGLSLLTKGPIGVVLAAGTIGGWTLWTGDWHRVRRLPWLRGIALTMLIAAPWYWLAERAQPGFLRYFFVHEHVLRYLQHEYGDRYGRGHDYPYGTIVVAFAIVALPWSLLGWAGVRLAWCTSDRWLAFAALWAAVPLLVFAFARNITAAYALPAVGGASIVVARVLVTRSVLGPAWVLWPVGVGAAFAVVAIGVAVGGGTGEAARDALGIDVARDAWPVAAGSSAALLAVAAGFARSAGIERRIAALALVMPIGFVGAATVGGPHLDTARSTRAVLRRCVELDAVEPITFLFRTPGSASFYAPARLDPTPGERTGRRPTPDRRVLVVRVRHLPRIDPVWRSELDVLDRVGPWVIARSR